VGAQTVPESPRLAYISGEATPEREPMTTFDKREQAFEAHFALDQEQEFKAQARRDRKLAVWAAERLGLSGDDIENYVLAVMRADLKEAGDDDVFQKVLADLAERDVEVLPHELRERMDGFLSEARREIAEGVAH
jgi:hypothetical protein